MYNNYHKLSVNSAIIFLTRGDPNLRIKKLNEKSYL